MNTTSFTISTNTIALINELKTNKVPVFESKGNYRVVIPVYKEIDLVDLICEIAEKTKASANIKVHYQDGSGFDQRTYNLRFIDGIELEEK